MDQQELRPLLRRKFPRERTYLLPALHFLQHEFGHLPGWALQTVSWHLRVPASEVYGAATSYSELRVQAPARHVVRVCTGLSCWTGGAERLLERLSSGLGAGAGGIAPDGKVTLETTACGFLCPMAPAIEVDGRWLGRVDAGKISTVISELT
jgi:NADH:ubiquinone oxidoreductase subunit E